LQRLLCLLPLALLPIFPIADILIAPSVFLESFSHPQNPQKILCRCPKNIESWLDNDGELLLFTVGTLKSLPSIQILALTNHYLRIGLDIWDNDIELNNIAGGFMVSDMICFSDRFEYLS
jgi:hypothetical protein